MKDKVPPHSFQAEVATLGAMICGASCIPDVMNILPRSADFYDQNHAAIFDAIIHVYDRQNPSELDFVLVQERLKTKGVYDHIGGDGKLAALAHGVPSAATATHYAKIVAEKAKLRRYIEACQTAIHEAYKVGGTGHESAKEVMDMHEAAIFELGQDEADEDLSMIGASIRGEMDRIDQNLPNGGIPSGLGAVDKFIQGFQPGEMSIIAARPSMGKTAMGLNIAEYIAIAGTMVGLFSLEMNKSSIAQRFLSSRSQVPSENIRSGAVGGLQLTSLVRASGELMEAPIVLDGSSSLTITKLRARARRMVRQFGAKIIIIDYLQLLKAPGSSRDGRFVEVAAISGGIKALARELNIPIVVMAQLNRNSEAREGNRPRMADLALSGSIEQDADVVMLLHRPEYYHVQDEGWADKNPDQVGLAEVIVAKHRNGQTGVAKLNWNAQTTRFTSRE